MELNEEHKEKFLEYLREGENPQGAAEAVAEFFGDPRITATKFKFLRGRDLAFNREFEDARVEGRGSLTDRLERCAQELALGGHWPALKFMLTTYGEQFAWARSNKIEVGGQIEVSAVAALLSRFLPPDEFDKVIEHVEKGMLEEGAPALPPAVGKAA